MTKDQIKAVLERVLTWPPQAQAEAVASLESIEQELSGPLPLSDDDRRALERSADDVRHGRFADDADVRKVFERFRRT
jgi:hypothetical protein